MGPTAFEERRWVTAAKGACTQQQQSGLTKDNFYGNLVIHHPGIEIGIWLVRALPAIRQSANRTGSRIDYADGPRISQPNWHRCSNWSKKMPRSGFPALRSSCSCAPYHRITLGPRAASARLLRTPSVLLTLIQLGVLPTAASLGQECPLWGSSSASLIPRLESHAMVYDSVRRQLVVFGGMDDRNDAEPQTLLYDGLRWTEVTGTSPVARAGHGLVFDSNRGVAVLFGGNKAGLLDDLWEWNGSQWILRPGGPSARSGHGMAFDIRRAVTVVTGGSVLHGSATDTWEWDGAVWTHCGYNPLLGPRRLQLMGYDARRGVVVLHGGEAAGGGPLHILEDTWEYDGVQWTRQSTLGPQPPRRQAAMTYDANLGAMVLFGGQATDSLGNALFLSDTWAWDGLEWRKILDGGPMGRSKHALAFDDTARALVLVGGTGKCRFGDTWTFDGQSWRSSSDGPHPFFGVANGYLIQDTLRKTPVVLSGEDCDGNGQADTWERTDGTWHRVATSGPVVRTGAGIAFDSRRGVSVLFGGYTDYTYNQHLDTWEWDGTTWSLRSTQGPPGRRWHSMTYDSLRGRVVLFGGFVGNFERNDTWEWDGGTWTNVANSGPRARRSAGFEFDRSRGVSVLFGGIYLNDRELGDTWEWDGHQWLQRSSLGPAPRYYPAMVHARSLNGVLLFGGGRLVSSVFEPLTDAWAWDGATWRPIPYSGDAPTSLGQFLGAFGAPELEFHEWSSMRRASTLFDFSDWDLDGVYGHCDWCPRSGSAGEVDSAGCPLPRPGEHTESPE